MGGTSPVNGGSMPTKWYYDRKIGTVNLKPGNLVLVKADAFKGRRKIKDRWEEDTWEVVHQIMTDIPSYKVMNQHGKSCILHWNQLLLIASEVGVPLCMATIMYGTGVPASPPARLPLQEVKQNGHHKRIIWKAVT